MRDTEEKVIHKWKMVGICKALKQDSKHFILSSFNLLFLSLLA